MWTSTIELTPRRVLLTRFLGYFWRGAYFSSFAPLQVQNVPRQTLPEKNWVRVRNRLAGINGSDLQFVSANADFRVASTALPVKEQAYPGREVVGEVIEVGEDVQRLQVGDRVALQYGMNCISQGVQPLCRNCAIGQFNLCEHGAFSGLAPIGGGWSEEMLLHESQLYRLPSELSDEQAVLLEPTAVALHAVLRRIPRSGEHVLIIGAGTTGLLLLQALRALAPDVTVSVMARHAFQVEQATRLGAAHILYPQDSYKGVQQTTGAQLYKGMFGSKMLLGGYDVVYDTIGTQHTLNDALRWTRAGGALVLVGLSLHRMRMDLTPVWYQEVRLIGSIGHGMETWPYGSPDRRSTFDVAAELIERGYLAPEKLITHRFALTDYPVALRTAADKAQTRSIKVVFDYALLPATIVPNVRANARRRLPLRTRTAPPAIGEKEEQEQVAQPVQAPQSQQQEEEWEAASATGTPMGGTWMHYVQPIPQSETPDVGADHQAPSDMADERNEAGTGEAEDATLFFQLPSQQEQPQIDTGGEQLFERQEQSEQPAQIEQPEQPTPDSFSTTGNQEEAIPPIPPHLLALTDTVETAQVVTEDHAPLPDVFEAPGEQFAQEGQSGQIEQGARTEEPAAFALHEPHPILMPSFINERADVAQEEAAAEAAETAQGDEGNEGSEKTTTFIPPRSSRPRSKSADRKTTSKVRATNVRDESSLE